MALEYFKNRRSVRKFATREVSKNLINDIIDRAVHAPTTGNMQLYSVVVSSGEVKHRLEPCHFNQPAATGAPVLLTVCVDFNRFEHWCKLNNAEPCYDNLQSLTMGVLDASIFAQQIVTVAEMEGLGTCYLGTTTYTAADIANVLNLPSRVLPLITIAIGYPAEMPDDCGRLPVEAVVHEEIYHDYTDSDIRAFYAEKEAREDSQKFVAENGKESLAQVFTDVRYSRDMMEGSSAPLAAFLKKNGF